MTHTRAPLIGTSPPIHESADLIAGRGCYSGDVALDQPLHIAFVRSQNAPGQIASIDIDDAAEAEGVHAVHTGADVAHLGALAVNPVIGITHLPAFQALTTGDIISIGQPVAAVLADHPWRAVDAAELVYAEIDDTDADPKAIAQDAWHAGDTKAAIKGAAHVVRCALQHPRLAPSPMEPRTIAVKYHADTGGVTVWHSTQTPHRSRSELASILGIDAGLIRVIARHVGGAFGMKASLYPEDVFAVWAAFTHKRDVIWRATRSEEFTSATQGRGVRSSGTLALDDQGRFLALEAETDAPIGPWLPNSGLITAWNAARVLPSGYVMPALDVRTTATQDHRTPTGIYRGAGRPEANMLMERLIDTAARSSGIDPIELRRRNLLSAAALPHDTATQNRLDSGDYARALDLLEAKTGYKELRAQQTQRRAAGELVGIGVGFYVEPSGNGWESARVTLNANGSALVASGSSSQGHGRETAFAQIAADYLELDLAQIEVRLADTDQTPEGIGALASRSTAIGGSAVMQACLDIRARQAKGESLPITAELRYENEGQAWGYGAYLAVISICRDTGTPSIEQVHCVDDTGRLINPDLVKGQIMGGFAQGFGEAMMEEVVFDEDNQLLTGSFMDYAMPRARDVPPVSITSFETSSPMNTLGAKGVGEAGTIGAPIALLNAAIDALAPLGVTELTMPLTAHRLWQAMRDAKGTET